MKSNLENTTNILNKINSINPDCQHWIMLWDMPTDYETYSQLKLSEKIAWQAWWQLQLEKGKELEMWNIECDRWHKKKNNTNCKFDVLYRIKAQPTYAERQKKWIEENNIQVGSKVRVIRKADCFENGWNSSWIDEMDEFVGNNFTVKSIAEDTSEIGLHLTGRPDIDYFPYFVLEPVKTKMVPLDFSDQLVGKVIVNNNGEQRHLILGQYSTGIELFEDFIDYIQLMNGYTTIDSQRFEKEIEL